jgi:CheY-like chemotaxis protein
MIIIDQQGEEKLLQHLERVRGQESSWRCLHLHLETIEVTSREQELGWLLSRLGDNDSYAYYTSQGEVFLLGRDYTVRDVRRAAHELNSRHQQTVLDPLQDFYELDLGWSRLIFMIDERVEQQRNRVRAEQIKQQAQQIAATRQAIINTPVDITLVSSINSRRRQHGKPVILVVEDEPFSGRLVENALNTDRQVHLVGDGQSAILSYARYAPHVLFLDIELPDISGHDVLQRIIQMDPQAYIVMLSGNADREHILRAMQAGAAGFVGKPFTRDKLGQYIERCPLLKTITRTGV